MVPDPYKALELMHDASAKDIKNSYRKLALRYHPDRLVARGASESEKAIAGDRFAAISAAYQLLSDPIRKTQYDHIYKYGGYDDDHPTETQRQPQPPTTKNAPSAPQQRNVGIGYSVTDPISYLFPKVSQSGKQAVAGIQIPSRVHLLNPRAGGGLRFAFSSGEFTTSKTGSRKFVATTTQFVHGKKYSRVETTTVYPDGRREIVIEGNDYVKRRWTTPPKRKVSREDEVRSVQHTEHDKSDEPWYVSAWNGIKKGLTVCHNPCGEEILVQ
jgi:hypothetical protein